MRKAIIILFGLFVFVMDFGLPAPAPEGAGPNLKSVEPVKKTDRILILVPHPDDEAIGCAGIIQEARGLKAPLRIVYLTNGDHNQVAFIVYEKRITLKQGEFIHMGQVRRKEAVAAMKLLGLSEKDLVFLGYPDFGTFSIFSQYWQDTLPFKSLLTRISSVPYKENFSFGAPYKGESMLSDLKKIILEYKPNKIFVSHPADTNVDHKTFYLLLQVALADLSGQITPPKIYPYLVHCVGWPLPRHYHPDLFLSPPQQFPDTQVGWSQYLLTNEEVEKKHRAVLCYKSQTESSAFYLLSFVRQNELFGDYPGIELKPQIAARGAGVQFFGSSNIFANSDLDTLKGLERLVQDNGQVGYAVADNSLLVRVEKAKGLGKRPDLALYLFGYKTGVPFASMPKVRIFTRHNKLKVFDAYKFCSPDGVSLRLNTDSLILKVPLALLGNPEFILAAVKLNTGFLSFGASAFRRIDIKS
jgi:LmbE family N-acetylglucosaminyl deacetylase